MTWLLTYVFNALWQVPLVFVAAWVVARLLAPVGAQVEHRVWVAAALLEALLPACPGGPGAWRGMLRGGWRQEHGGGAVSVAASAAVHGSGLAVSPAVGFAVAALYGAALLFFAARVVRGAVLTARLRRCARPVRLLPEMELRWQQLRRRMGVRAVWLAESEELRTAVTFGLGSAAIVFPAGLLAALSGDEVEAVLAHEAAHIRRRDYAHNLLLQLWTLPVRFHPALWLTMERLAGCREMVCDSLACAALSHVGGRSRYARSLLRLASALAQGASAVAPNAIGLFDAHTLERRIMNLTQHSPRLPRLRRAALVTAAFALTCATTVSALALRTSVSADPVHVGGAVMAAEVHSKVQPKYPQAAKDAHIQGAVVMRAIIGKDGAIDKLSVVSGPPELCGSALEAVRQWTYNPYLVNGEPTEVETTITVTYTLAN